MEEGTKKKNVSKLYHWIFRSRLLPNYMICMYMEYTQESRLYLNLWVESVGGANMSMWYKL